MCAIFSSRGDYMFEDMLLPVNQSMDYICIATSFISV